MALSMRDQFAMAAMTGLASVEYKRYMDDDSSLDPDFIAGISYRIADEMIKARGQNAKKKK